jgi:dipeptidyl aminopeptidase/acylaminoacyl peptidase
MRRLAAVLLLCVCVPAWAAEPVKRTHTVTIDDYFTLAHPMEVALTPGGQGVAWAEARWQKSSDDRKADLWVAETATGKSRRLTFDRPGVRALRWSPDAKAVYYLAARRRASEKEPPHDGKPQVWRTTVADGRSSAVTRVPGGVEAYDLDRDAKRLYYVVNVAAKAKGPFRKLKEEMKEVDYADSGKVSQLWRLDLDTWRADKLLDEGRFIREMVVSPAGRRVAMISTPDDTVVSFEGQSRVEVHDTQTGKTAVLPDRPFRADAPSPYAWLEHLAWAPSGRMLAFNSVFDGHPAEIIVGRFEESWQTWKMRRPEGVHVRGYGSPLAWSSSLGEPALYFLGERAGVVSLWEAPLHNAARGKEKPVNRLAGTPVVVDALSVAPAKGEGDRIALVLGTPAEFRDIWLLGKEGKPRRLTRLNPQTDTWKLPKVSVVAWKGANGERVEGILDLPPDAKPGVPLPLVVAIHGGPTSATLYQMDYDMYRGRVYLTARGYAVLCPNYRGSTGYGDRFLTDLIGRENDIEVKDILAGVDALVLRKLADPERLAVMGWSNGGYLTNCAVSATTRFKAASSGASITDTVMEWGANDEPAYPLVFKGGPPWEKPDAYRRASPTYQLNRIRTPTVIHVGGNDDRCPPGQSRMLYRALKLYNKVPTELLVYPGAPHGLSKYSQRRAKMTWDLAWFDRYVLGKKE